uniref:N-acetyltransferase domain-containing protein n=2 Tax=Hemiselmis andersenii TaxID=464988 RepID=A0A6U4U890_HEMAN|mmetsp:Transcript_22512/g.54811  ORF Transcript_22512/g.54811 Transcript_22512/m.54811 type:complete len:240 (+) Transcript_22512:106-825(+)
MGKKDGEGAKRAISASQLQEIPEDLISRAAEMIAEEFVDGPAHVEIFRGERDWRKKAMANLFERNIRMHLGTGAIKCYLIPGEGDMEGRMDIGCFFVVERKDTFPTALAKYWAMLRVGLWVVPFQVGFGVLSRLLTFLDWEEERYKRLGPNSTCMLQRMIVAKRLRRTGVGTACVSAALEEVGGQCILSTQTESALAFWEHMGFQVAERAVYEAGSGDGGEKGQFNYENVILTRSSAGS